MEPLQRLLRKKFKSGYKMYWANLRKDKAKLRRSIVQHRVNNKNKKKRTLNAEVSQLRQHNRKRHTHRRIRKTKKFTWFSFKAHFQKEENGGFNELQCREEWHKVTLQPHCDEKGIVNGVHSHERWRVELDSDTPESEDANESDVEYSRGTRAKMQIDQGDVDDALLRSTTTWMSSRRS